MTTPTREHRRLLRLYGAKMARAIILFRRDLFEPEWAGSLLKELHHG